MFRYFLLIVNLLVVLHAESGADAWLRHAPLDEASARQYATLPAAVVTFTATPPAQSAQCELLRGVRGMLGRTLRCAGIKRHEVGNERVLQERR
jgi:alpha-glucuronidase